MSSRLRKQLQAATAFDETPPARLQPGVAAASVSETKGEVTRPFLRQGGHQDKLLNVPVNRIRANPDQPRKHFEQDALLALARSIEREGLLQPVSVRQLPDEPDTYMLVAGERRLQAIRDHLRWTSVPARIYRGSNAAGAALAENLVRADLNVVEKAEALERYRQEAANGPLTNRQIQDELGVSLAQISRLTKVTTLPEAIKAPIREGRVSLPMVRLEQLAEITEFEAQLAAFEAASHSSSDVMVVPEAPRKSQDSYANDDKASRRKTRGNWEAGPYFERTMTNARRLSVRLQRIGPYGPDDLGGREVADDLKALEELREEIDRFLARQRQR